MLPVFEDAELPQLLMEIGYTATGSGLHREAAIVFDGVAALRPRSEMPWIGRAITELNNNRPNEARRILQDEALRLAPESECARGFLGLALQKAGHGAESFAIFADLAEHGKDPTARSMAASLLNSRPI